MKRIISILLLLIFVCTMVTSCSKLGSRQYVLDVLDAMDKGDDERFYNLLEDKIYDINRNPNLLIDRIVFFFPCVDNPLEKACRLEQYDYVEALLNRGADPDGAKSETYTALKVAAIFPDNNDSYKIAKLLIEYGASEKSIERAYKRAIVFEAPQEFLDLLNPDK